MAQNAAAQLILLEDPRCPVYAMYERLNMDTLATGRAKSMVKLTCSVLHNKSPANLYDKLVPVSYGTIHIRATDSGELVIPRVHTKYGQYAFSFRAPLQWNLTSIDLKAAVNKVQLKNLIRTSWKS